MQGEAKFQVSQDLLKNQVKPYQTIEKAHPNSIQSTAAHPSNKLFASGSHDHTIKLWDLGKLKQTATLHDHKEGVWSLDYSKDGKMLVSASPDKNVLIWDAGKSSAGRKLIAHKDKVYCAKFNQNDKYIASVGEGAQLLIWDTAKTDKPMKSIELKSIVGYDISWSNKNDFLFVSTMGLKTVAIDTKQFKIISQDVSLEGHPDQKMLGITVNWNTLQNKVFTASQMGHIVWYEWKQNKLMKEIEFEAHIGGCRNVVLHPHQKYLISSGKDGSVRLWNCNKQGKPQIQSNLVLHQQNVTSPIFLGDEYVVTGSWDQSIGIWKYKDLLT